jgi:VWFA-related protein
MTLDIAGKRCWRTRFAFPRRGRLVAICLVCFGGSSIAQNGSFIVQSNVVQVPVIVTERHGRNVDGLLARDFRLLDNGAPQEVTVDDFSSGLAPISLAIAIQTSGFSAPALAMIRHIGGMIQPLVIGDRGEAAVVTFDCHTRWLQDFTPNDDKISNALKSVAAASNVDQARMLDAVVEVADRMQQRKGRKVLLLISESRDRGSESTFRQSIEAVEREGIEVFGAYYSAYSTTLFAKPKDLPVAPPPPAVSPDPSDWPDSPPGVDFLAIFSEIARLGKTNAVQALTRVTGGADYPFMTERDIGKAILKLGEEVHSQYILSFPQRQNATGAHQIAVSAPNHGDFAIRSRRTYWAGESGDAH